MRSRIVLANRRAEALFDYPRDALVGQSVNCLIPEGSVRDMPALRRVPGRTPDAGHGRESDPYERAAMGARCRSKWGSAPWRPTTA